LFVVYFPVSPNLEMLVLFITYLLTPWSKVLLEKLTVLKLVNKFPAFYGTRRFITAFTSAATCPYPESPQSKQYPTSNLLKIHLNIILPFTLGSPKWNPSLRFSYQNPVYASLLPHTRYMPRPSHSSRLYHPTILGEEYRSLSSSLCNFLYSPVTKSLLCPNILLSTIKYHPCAAIYSEKDMDIKYWYVAVAACRLGLSYWR
jgi:hypothetical protein